MSFGNPTEFGNLFNCDIKKRDLIGIFNAFESFNQLRKKCIWPI